MRPGCNSNASSLRQTCYLDAPETDLRNEKNWALPRLVPASTLICLRNCGGSKLLLRGVNLRLDLEKASLPHGAARLSRRAPEAKQERSTAWALVGIEHEDTRKPFDGILEDRRCLKQLASQVLGTFHHALIGLQRILFRTSSDFLGFPRTSEEALRSLNNLLKSN